MALAKGMFKCCEKLHAHLEDIQMKIEEPHTSVFSFVEEFVLYEHKNRKQFDNISEFLCGMRLGP